MGDDVEVVYSIEVVKQAVLLIVLGVLMGGTTAAGYYTGQMRHLADRGAVINGDVTITKKKIEPMTISHITINANGADYGLKIVEVQP